jgi:hypothetical protein
VSRSRGRGLAAVAIAALAVSGCSTAASVVSHRPAAHSTAPAAHSTAAASARPASTQPGGTPFTVSGDVPVQPNASQDTRAEASGPCQPRQLRRDKALGQATMLGFVATGANTAAALLTHFLAGSGSAVRYENSSAIAGQARASSAFQALNRAVAAQVASQLRAGRTRVRLTGLPLVAFERPGTDLYLSFRGTQGLRVSGSGTRTRHGYFGTLSYTIEDSYGFPPQDVLLGIGTAMRYLQVNCGNTRGGAHWFPDSVTVTVPLKG